MRRLAVALGAAALSIAAPAPARAAGGECNDNEGITVVVDLREFGDGVHARCAPQPVEDGFDALERAGIAYQTTSQGFICRIAGKPSEEEERCLRTPPASAFWGYWIAGRGGDWCYSNNGPAYRRPPPGSVEGWSFAKDKASGGAPPPDYEVPGPVPGTQANQLPPGDCNQPAPTPTTKPGQSAPPPTTPSGPQPPSASGAGTAHPGASQPWNHERDRTGEPGVAGESGELPIPGSPGLPSGVEPATPTGGATEAGGFALAAPVVASSATGSTEEASPVIDLSPAAPPSSPAGTAVALGIVAGLASVSVWTRRRARRPV